MATSGALDTSNTYIKYKITITENSYSTSNNTSNVTVTVNFYRTNTGYTTYGTGTVYCTIDGTQYTASVTSSQKITNSGINLFSKTLTISHNSDGSKSLTVSAYISHSQFSSSSQSFTTSLTTIARASSITSASSVTLGNACSITWTPASSSYAYKIKFTIGSNSVTTGYISPGTTSAYTYTGYTMSIADWAPYITSATSGTCTATLYTYSSSSSSSSLGSSTKTFTVTVPSSVTPTVSIGSVVEGNSAVSIGIYVQNMSTIKLTFTGTMAYSSSLKSYSVTIGSLSYSGTSISSGTSITLTSGTLTDSGSVSVKVSVTDARGRSGSASRTITVYEYSPPQITEFKAQRADEDRTPNDNGDCVLVTYSYTVSSLNGQNSCTATMQYKESTGSDYSTTFYTSHNLQEEGYSQFLSTYGFSDQKGYDFRITLTDIFNTATVISSIGTCIVPLSIYWNGTGVAIGKNADTGSLFDVALKEKITYHSSPQMTIKGADGGNNMVYYRAIHPSGTELSIGIHSDGISRGLYDRTVFGNNTSYGGFFCYVNGNNNVLLGSSSRHNAVYVGNTSIPLYLRGSSISVSGSISNYLIVGESSSTSWNYVRAQNSYGGMSLSAYTDGSTGLYNSTLSEWFCRYYADDKVNRFGNGARGTEIYGSGIALQNSVTVAGTVTATGNITSGSSSSTSAQRVYAYNSYARGSLSVDTNGNFGLYDWGHNKWVIYSNSSGSITTNSAIAIVSALSTDDVDSGISTLSAGTFKDPGSDMLANLTSHTYEENGHKHIGLTVDETEAAMQAAGMNPDEYDITEHWIDEDGNEVGAIRYDELIPILINEVQDLQTEVQDLQTQIATLTK